MMFLQKPLVVVKFQQRYVSVSFTSCRWVPCWAMPLEVCETAATPILSCRYFSWRWVVVSFFKDFFTSSWGDDSIWLIFFNWVETTNYVVSAGYETSNVVSPMVHVKLESNVSWIERQPNAGAEPVNMDFWLVVSNIVYFHPYLGRWSNLTHIFQIWVEHH